MSGRRLRRYLRWMRAESARFEALEQLRARFPEATIEDGVHVVSPDRLELGPGAIVQAGCHLHCGGTDWTDGGGHIRIGRQTVISPHSVLWGGGGLDIGPGVFTGPGVMIFASQELFEVHPEDPGRTHKLAPVRIGAEARIGAQAIIGPGAVMEDASVLAGSSLLVGTVPSGKLYGGIPAKELRELRTFRHTLT